MGEVTVNYPIIQTPIHHRIDSEEVHIENIRVMEDNKTGVRLTIVADNETDTVVFEVHYQGQDFKFPLGYTAMGLTAHYLYRMKVLFDPE